MGKNFPISYSMSKNPATEKEICAKHSCSAAAQYAILVTVYRYYTDRGESMSRQMELQPMETTLGQLTGASLRDAGRLFLPYGVDAFGGRRRALGLDGLKLSFELARMAYTLDVEPWMRAGWTDFSIQVDNQLITDMTSREDQSIAERKLSMLGSLKLTRARRALKESNPLARVTGALRQLEESDTLKAVVMIHPAQDGRYVVAIGFMGTGARLYDWFSNFRVSTEDGFHKGFYQLTQTFLKNEGNIQFPDTAKALGLKALTLSDILTEMQEEDSRFSLWMAGHSQGAAVMQVYCDRLLRNKQIPSARVIGCGFASPHRSSGRYGAGCPCISSVPCA